MGFSYEELDAYLAGERGPHAEVIAGLIAASAHKRATAPLAPPPCLAGPPLPRASRSAPQRLPRVARPAHSGTLTGSGSMEVVRMTIVVQKYGGSSVASTEHIMNVARRIVATYDAGNSVCAVISARGDTTDELLAMAHEITPAAARARARHAALGRRAHQLRPAGHGDPHAGPRSGELHRLAGGYRHRHDAHQGEDRGHLAAAGRTGPGRRQDHAGRRLSGRLDQQGRDHPGPRRLRHHRGGAWLTPWAPGSARSTPTSTASTRPTPRSSPRRASCTRSPTRRCSRWRPRARRYWRCARSSTRAATTS